ncbi:MAG: NAD-dependent epimerase [Flavobacteriaceae bacterium]
MKVLVTGTAGFIGFHLTNKLVTEGHQVIGVDSINDYYDVSLKWDRLEQSGLSKSEIQKEGFSKKENYSFYQCQLNDKEQLKKIFEDHDIDAVCNLAAQAGVRYSLENPSAYIESNIIGFQNIIDLVRDFGIKNFSYASSSSVYGGNTNLPFSEKDRVDSPISLYAATKKSNELVAYTYSHLFGIQSTGLRFFTVYGPWGRPDMALFLFVSALLKNEEINVFNHGNMLRDFTFIDDIVEGVYRVILSPPEKQEVSEGNPTGAPYKIYNIGNNNPVKLMDFIESIEQVLDKKFKINFMDIQPGDVPSTYANVEDLIKDHNYKPQTPIKEGISRFVEWYLAYYNISR